LNNNKEHNVELLLEYSNNSKNLLDVFKLNNEINILKNEIILLKNEINKLKNKEDSDISEENEDDNDSSNNSKTENKDNINNIDILCDIVNDSYSDLSLSDTFTVFKSINDILYLIYSNKNSSIIFYNIVDNKKIKEIEKAHDKYITNFRHFLDDINKRDLILSISDDDNIIKIWTIYGNNTIDFLFEIKANQVGYLYSACILKENNNLYIISSNSCSGDSENIKVFDLKGEKIKEINNSNDTTNYIDIYYDNKSSKNYILTCNEGYIKSYDYNNNDVYKQYSDNEENGGYSAIIRENNEISEIIESSYDGFIRIWNFHSAELLKKIKINDDCLKEICMWNNEYIFVGCEDKTIKIIDINNEKIIKDLKGHKNEVISIKIINHPKYGKSLISQGSGNDSIKLWICKDN
jgi:hypothetical protein